MSGSKFLIPTFAACALLLSSDATTLQASPVQNQDHVLAKVAVGAGGKDAAEQLKARDAKPLFEGSDDPVLSRWFIVPVEAGAEEAEAADLTKGIGIEIAEPEGTGPTPGFIPNDPCYSGPIQPQCPVPWDQWGAQRIASAAAWDISQGSDSTILAVIDSGVNFAHQDLNGKQAGPERDYTNTGSGDGCPTTLPSHGSHVAGIAAAQTNNGLGIAGIGFNTRLRSYKILRESQGSCGGENAWLAQAIRQAADDGAHIINMSLQNAPNLNATQEAINYARTRGAVVVGIAGNDGTTSEEYPGNHSGVITVAASDVADGKWGSSQYGNWVEMSAPGESILSTVHASAYDRYDGTSMSAPHVAGVAALLASRGFHRCEIEETLLGRDDYGELYTSGTPVSADNTGWDGDGLGRLNAGKALAWWGGAPIARQGSVPENSLIKDESDGKVYVVRGGTRYWIHSVADFDAMGFNWRNVQCVPSGFLAANGITDVTPRRTLVAEFGSAQEYVVVCGDSLIGRTRFALTSPEKNALWSLGYLRNNPAIVIPPGELNDFLATPPDTCQLRELQNELVYWFCAGGRWLYTPQPQERADFIQQKVGVSLAPDVLPNGRVTSFPQRFLHHCLPDTDEDAFGNFAEAFYGTDPLLACAATSTRNDEPEPDRWPLDLDDNGIATTRDVGLYVKVLNSSVEFTPSGRFPYAPRYDLRVDGIINTLDIGFFIPHFNKLDPLGCSQAGGSFGGEPDGGQPGAPESASGVSVAVDANGSLVPANTANNLGTREECSSLSDQPVFAGTSTGGNSSTTLNDGAATFAIDLRDFALKITGGTGQGQVRRITANTLTQLTVEPAWMVVPDATTSYVVLPTVYVDITVSGIPEADLQAAFGGITALGVTVHFDGSKVTILAVNPNGESDTILASGGPRTAFDWVDADMNTPETRDPFPSSSGALRAELTDLSLNIEHGDGVLARLLVAPVGAGISDLVVDPEVIDFTPDDYALDAVHNGRLAIGTVCPP